MLQNISENSFKSALSVEIDTKPAPADADHISIGDDDGFRYHQAIDTGSIAAVSILQPPLTLPQRQERVFAAGKVILDRDGIAWRAPDTGQWSDRASFAGQGGQTTIEVLSDEQNSGHVSAVSL